MEAKLNYGNWIRKRILVILGGCALGAGLLTLLPIGPYRVIPIILFIIVFISFLFPLYAYLMFSQKGGRFQEKLYNLILKNLEPVGKGKILDIGSGNGVLAVKAALQNRDAQVTGMDYWGADWEYSKGVCEENAKRAGVNDRVHFQKGDAAALDFPSDTFDSAISNLTFHEVRSVPDKRNVLKEALRVVKPAGAFAFIDYFYEPEHYGQPAEFQMYLKNLGLAQVECKPLHAITPVPFLLRHPKILGKAGIIHGRK
jgi:SAM-dependent methyltransferase